MEVFAALIPIVVGFSIYLIILGLCIWFVVVFLKRQKERNEALRDIANQLKYLRIDQKEE